MEKTNRKINSGKKRGEKKVIKKSPITLSKKKQKNRQRTPTLRNLVPETPKGVEGS